MDQAADASRSVSACLRCRKQKLKCGGPGKIPCQRCRASHAECVFVPPKAVQLKSTSQSDSDAKISLLEQRLDLVESQLRGEIQELRNTIAQAPYTRESPQSKRSSHTHPGQDESIHVDLPMEDMNRPSDIVSESEWNELYEFFMENCRTTVSVVDDQLFAPAVIIRQHPLISTVICAIASRAIKPGRYFQLVTEADRLVASTFQGPPLDLLSLYAILLFALWTGRIRLLGYAASVAAEMRLHEAALQLGEEGAELTESLVTRARAWLALCSLDLQINISRPYVINKMKPYLSCARKLLTSPYRRLVDDRICGYINGFTIIGNVKGNLQKSQLQITPFPQDIADFLISHDEEIDRWFHQVNNSTNPLYQSFPEKQDRNRFMVPFAFMKLYINGLAMHGVESAEELLSDPTRIGFIQRALDSASLIIQTQYESEAFRQAFRYTMDYNGTPTYYAISFILKALPVSHKFVDCKRLLTRLQQAAQMFEQAGAIDAANDVRRDGDRVAVLTQTVLSPETYENPVEDTLLPALFDIPSFFGEMGWDEDFPALDMLPFDLITP